MDLTRLINHPEFMDRETLYDLRSLLALYPYFQTARLLMLQNLYLLHDPSFDEELRKSAIYINDRSVIFNLVEVAHYQLRKPERENPSGDSKPEGDRTLSLIDNYLDTVPRDTSEKSVKQRPTTADAAIDYVSYLLETEGEKTNDENEDVPQMKGQNLIDNFIINDKGKIQLKEDPEYTPAIADEASNLSEDGYFTETLARIYIKQGRYSKAIEIIKRLNLNYSKKNVYFADQIRFLEKLILNNKNNK